MLQSSPLVRAVETSDAVEKAYGGELHTHTTELLKPDVNYRLGYTTQFVKDLRVMP